MTTHAYQEHAKTEKKKRKDRSKASNSSVLGPFLSKIAPGMVDKGGAARNKKEEREKEREKEGSKPICRNRAQTTTNKGRDEESEGLCELLQTPLYSLA